MVDFFLYGKVIHILAVNSELINHFIRNFILKERTDLVLGSYQINEL